MNDYHDDFYEQQQQQQQQMMTTQKTPPAGPTDDEPEGESSGSGEPEETPESDQEKKKKGKGGNSFSTSKGKKFTLIPEEFQEDLFLGLDVLESLMNRMNPRTAKREDDEFKSHVTLLSRRDEMYHLLDLLESFLPEIPPSVKHKKGEVDHDTGEKGRENE